MSTTKRICLEKETEIRSATEDDLREVLRWSRLDDLKDSDSFYCNAGAITKAHINGQMFVFSYKKRAIAFFAYYGETGLIFAVRAKCREKGYGRQLATFMINRAPLSSVIRIECAPSSSKSF